MANLQYKTKRCQGDDDGDLIAQTHKRCGGAMSMGDGGKGEDREK